MSVGPGMGTRALAKIPVKPLQIGKPEPEAKRTVTTGRKSPEQSGR